MRRVATVGLAFVGLAALSTPAAAAGDDLCVLLYSRTEGFRHGSIDVAVPALQTLGSDRGWTVDATEDPTTFTTENLDQYDVVVFLLTTGDVLDDAQQGAFEAFIGQGRGYVGVHSASDTEYDWPWYGELLGGYFDGHPQPQDATIDVVDATHPSTEHLGAQWMRFDEWYNFAPNPSATVDVLLRLDETTYTGGTMGDDHPIAWTHEYGGGRAFYTAGGHTNESYAEPDFMTHLEFGITWAAGTPDGGGTSTGAGPTTGDEGTSSEPGATTSGDEAEAGEDGTPASTGPQTSGGSPTSSAGTATGTEPAGQDSSAGCGCNGGDWQHTLPTSLLMLVIVARRRRPARYH